MSDDVLKAPFPWLGGKSTVANVVWRHFGDVPNYVEPFFGSGAVLLRRPAPWSGTETVNDLDGLVANFWRAVQADAATVASYADWPVNENDLHARHAWLVGQKDSLQARLEGDPEFYDAKVAGWWVWGMACWIGGEFCSGKGPWQVVEVDGVKVLANTGDGTGDVKRRLVHLGNAGQGVNRKLVHLGNAGRGVNRQRVHLHAPVGVQKENVRLYEWMAALSERLKRVRVCCGDWSRVCGPTPTVKQGTTAVFLDPPYSAEAGRDKAIYRVEDLNVAHAVRAWCLERGSDRRLRIALCGYEGEGHEELEAAGWRAHAWKAQGGYGAQGDSVGKDNCKRERIWFSPHCAFERGLFDAEDA